MTPSWGSPSLKGIVRVTSSSGQGHVGTDVAVQKCDRISAQEGRLSSLGPEVRGRTCNAEPSVKLSGVSSARVDYWWPSTPRQETRLAAHRASSFETMVSNQSLPQRMKSRPRPSDGRVLDWVDEHGFSMPAADQPSRFDSTAMGFYAFRHRPTVSLSAFDEDPLAQPT
jgi:hypothetical protein